MTTATDILIGSNPQSVPRGRNWSARTRRQFDVMTWDYGPDADWSIACNQDRIARGTVGWLWQADGSFGHLAALMVFDGGRRRVREAGGSVDYFEGTLWRLPQEWWLDGARVSRSGWPANRAPFGAGPRVFRNGECLRPDELAVLRRLLHPVAREWLDHKVREFDRG